MNWRRLKCLTGHVWDATWDAELGKACPIADYTCRNCGKRFGDLRHRWGMSN
jgi:hypothetical protein